MIKYLEIHRYAPELNKIHMVNGDIIPAAEIDTMEKAEWKVLDIQKRKQ